MRYSFAKEKTKIYNRTDYEKKNKVPYKVSSCQQIVSSPQINWDGRLLGCCCNFKHDFGVNVFEIGLENALKSDLYKKTMDILQGKIPDDGTTPCSKCRKYKFMKENNAYVKFNIIQNWIFRKIYQLFY